ERSAGRAPASPRSVLDAGSRIRQHLRAASGPQARPRRGQGITMVTLDDGESARGELCGQRQVPGGSALGESVTVDGVQTMVTPGSPKPVGMNDFQGFSPLVDNPPVLNVLKAGQAVALKWRLLDAHGSPVTNLATATITVTSLSFSLGTSTDQIEEVAAG